MKTGSKSVVNRILLGSAALVRTETGLRFLNLPCSGKRYVNAQIDDYQGLSRRDFLWRPPLALAVRARFSHPAGSLLGTAGFGFWNDPFLMTGWRPPTLPRALWFFHASQPSDMSLALGVPGHGWKAAVIDALRPAAAALIPAAPFFITLLQGRDLYRLVWPQLQRILNIAERPIPVAMDGWHTYRLEWQETSTSFWVDGEPLLMGAPAPRGPLGLVVWLDNQWMVAKPTGRLGHGLLAIPHVQWMEIADLVITRP